MWFSFRIAKHNDSAYRIAGEVICPVFSSAFKEQFVQLLDHIVLVFVLLVIQFFFLKANIKPTQSRIELCSWVGSDEVLDLQQPRLFTHRFMSLSRFS